jgi:hypothetical protein
MCGLELSLLEEDCYLPLPSQKGEQAPPWQMEERLEHQISLQERHPQILGQLILTVTVFFYLLFSGTRSLHIA